MTSPAIAAGQEGARYQYRFFWRAALPMLYLDPPRIEKVVMEHRGVSAVDDVVVYYTNPGVADAERLVRVDYYQLKFHVAHSKCIASSDLIDPAFTNAARSLLWRFAESWKTLRADGANIRLNFVTNWGWCPGDPLPPLIRDTGALHEDFLAKSLGSEVGKVRSSWRAHLTLLDDTEFAAFIRELRLCMRAVSQSEAEEWLADRCDLAGLRRPDPGENHSPYDDLAGRLLAQGRREFTRDDLALLVQQENLRVAKEPPFRSTCAIRSFRRFAHVPETDAHVIVDLTPLFRGREPINDEVWVKTVRERLEDALPQIDTLPKPVQLALDTHLSIGWYAGALLDAKAGIPILLRQKGYGTVTLWDTIAPKAEPQDGWQFSKENLSDAGELALAISVTHDVAAEAREVAVASGMGTFVHARLSTPGGTAIKSGGHAVWLADELASAVRENVREQKAARVHVFPACPVAFAFLLGQRSAALGPVTVYEYDFGGSKTYRPAMST
jgi:hypothetical protein